MISFFISPVHQWLFGEIVPYSQKAWATLDSFYWSALDGLAWRIRFGCSRFAIAWANPDIAKHKRLNIIPVTTNCPDSSVRNKAKRFPVCKKLPVRITKTKIQFFIEMLVINLHRIHIELHISPHSSWKTVLHFITLPVTKWPNQVAMPRFSILLLLALSALVSSCSCYTRQNGKSDQQEEITRLNSTIDCL